MPIEAQGAGTNTVVVKVTDSGTPVLSATNSFVVVVNQAIGLVKQTPTDLYAAPAFDLSTLKHKPDAQGFSMSFTGIDGKSYNLLGSDDLMNWVFISNVIAGPNPVTFVDPATNKPQRFYRLVE
jgi:hypothetical protein